MKGIMNAQIRAMAEQMADANPDAAQLLAELLAEESRKALVHHQGGAGIVMRFPGHGGELQIRGGNLDGYIAQGGDAVGYHEGIYLPPSAQRRKEKAQAAADEEAAEAKWRVVEE
jgi:hypothetical protein